MLSPHERALRFHPGCYYRDLVTGETQTLPALIAAVSGLQRTWLDPSGQGKAQLADPRRSLGDILGNGILLGHQPGAPVPVMAAGEASRRWLRLRW
ncbi:MULTISPECIES: DUF7146 domain-containing protein [Rhizobium]|uniref:DUF7146 domain-containing protein n=1 Tax=Rhizobium TaxID=379 RepID=UPI003B834077